MIQVRHILCPIDFSDFSRRALDHAAAIARWYEASVTLLHVCTAMPAAAYATGTGILPSDAFTHVNRQELLRTMKRFAGIEAGNSVPIEFEIADGDVPTAILERARTMPADVLVVGTHGRSGFDRLALGSVAEKVLRKAACPVLSIPPHAADGSSVPSPIFRSIVCAIDFSTCSMHALEYAMSLAQEASARLTVVHVIEVGPVASGDLPETRLSAPRSLHKYLAAAEEEGQRLLRSAIPEPVRAYCAVETRLATGMPYREILRIAAAQGSDLIVMGVHGRGAADLLFFGSTTQHVVRKASCPVLTLRTL